jgi:hypothetical protein
MTAIAERDAIAGLISPPVGARDEVMYIELAPVGGLAALAAARTVTFEHEATNVPPGLLVLGASGLTQRSHLGAHAVPETLWPAAGWQGSIPRATAVARPAVDVLAPESRSWPGAWEGLRDVLTAAPAEGTRRSVARFTEEPIDEVLAVWTDLRENVR